MTTTMDIAVCLDGSSSLAFYSYQIRLNILSILNQAFGCYRSDIRMALIEFQSHLDDWITSVHPFTSSMGMFQQWISGVQNNGIFSDEDKAIADALSAALALDWRPNNQADRFHEKLVILVTDGAPCGLLNDACPCDSYDLWRIADEFEKQDIILVVIGIEPNIAPYDDFYCALANKTGGEYLPFINARRVLSSVIPRAIIEEDTLSQLFRRLNVSVDIEHDSRYHYSAVQGRARFMIEYCRTMTDIRKRLFTYCQQPTEHVIEDVQYHSSPINANYLSYPDENMFASTPVTDDEGYRTRLPTTASSVSSFIQVLSSPVLPRHLFWDLNSEIDDDECF